MAFQAWARRLHTNGQYAVSREVGNAAALHLFPFQQNELGIQFVGFWLPKQELQKASLLRKRILLVLDLDETLVTSHSYAGLQVRT